jgi:protein-S-isoprenylcysteine O-methyltransferase Ste14
MRDRVLIVLARVVGGGSLLLFVYLFGRGGLVDLHLGVRGALAWDTALSFAFFLQHSLMVRTGARARLARVVPAYTLGAVYSVASGLVLTAVGLLWQPTGPLLAAVGGPARWLGPGVAVVALCGFAWAVVSLRHFDPFGARAVAAHLRGAAPRPQDFSVRGPYRWVRHPLYLFTLVLIWSSPQLTADRLLFDVLWTAWILAGTVLEERDLVAELGPAYVAYQRQVPMLLPWRRPMMPTH